MSKINRILAFLRLTDESGNLSMTTLVCWVVLVKLAFMPATGVDIVALFIALVNYSGKKLIALRSEGAASIDAEDYAALSAQVAEMKNDIVQAKAEVTQVMIASGFMK